MVMSVKVKVKPKGKTRSQMKSIDDKYYGPEPLGVDGSDEIALGQAFNWYNYMHDVSQAKKWLMEYLKREKRTETLANVRAAPDWKTSTTAGWVARMIMNGTVFNESYMTRFEERIQLNALAGVKEEVEETPVKTNVVSIQERVKRNIHNLITDAEEEFDKNPEFSMYEFLTGREASAQAATAIRDYYLASFEELRDADDQIKEAYGKKLKFWLKIYSGIMDDCNRYLGNKKVVKIRKPREKKVKSAVDQVKNLKFQKDFPPLKIVSVNPAEIVGCKQLWTYNTKYKKLTRYDASDPAGIQVKGTTLIGYDVETSLTKSLRKPDITLQSLLTAGKVALRSLLEDLKTNETKPNGRINPETILLRVIK